MNRRLAALLCGFSLLTGCVVHNNNNNPGPLPGDITFLWTFVGRTCAEEPNVSSVVISIPGETLQNGGVYPCSANGVDGIVLHDFAGGSYSYTVSARDYGDQELFAGSGIVNVDGSKTVSVDMTPSGSAPTYALLQWSFAPNWATATPSCLADNVNGSYGTAQVDFVDVTIDGTTTQRYDCSAGQGSSFATTPYLAAGTHTIDIVAYDQGSASAGHAGYTVAHASGTFTTSQNAPTSQAFTLTWVVGGANLQAQYGSTNQSCSAAGVVDLIFNMHDAATYSPPPSWNNTWLYGASGDVPIACASAYPAVYNKLPPGTYVVDAVGRTNSADTSTYWYATLPLSTITVTAGSWPSQVNVVPMQ